MEYVDSVYSFGCCDLNTDLGFINNDGKNTFHAQLEYEHLYSSIHPILFLQSCNASNQARGSFVTATLFPFKFLQDLIGFK